MCRKDQLVRLIYGYTEIKTDRFRRRKRTNLSAVGEVAEDADGVLHALVVDVGALDGVADQVEQGVHQALALTQLLPTVVARRAHVSENKQ